MKHQNEANYILSLLKSAVRGTTAPFPLDDLDWDVIFKFAQKHRIYITMFFAMQTLPEDIKKTIPNYSAYELAYKKYLVTDANRSYYLELLKSDFDAAGMDYVLLKGSVSKYLYPDTAMRTMRDIDILYRNAENNTLIDVFKKNGFDVSKIEPKEISFKMAQLGLQVEVQKHLVNEVYGDWFKYLENVWERCEQKNNHEYVMTNEDFYIYHLIHMAKHFKHGGIGLIHVLDTYVIRNAYELDYDYIERELDTINLRQFEKVILDLIDVWFENGTMNETLEDVAQYIWNNGAFGSKTQQEVNKAVSENNGKISLRRRIFPNVETIADYYGDYVQKHPWSLPLYWIKLNVERLFRGKNQLTVSLKTINNVSQEQIDKTKKVFDYCGIK